MMRYSHLKHQFVQHIPRDLDPGVLYISVEYGTAAHSCCCGCGEEIVTPFTPTDWKMTFDGETISLWPSVGNWNLACRSHYVIQRGQVIKAAPWSDKQIVAGRRRDKAAKVRYFGTPDMPVEAGSVLAHPRSRSVWSKILRWFTKSK